MGMRIFSQRQRPFNFYVILVIACCLVPALVLGVYTMITFHAQERQVSERQILGVARAVSSTVDRSLEASLSALSVLSILQTLRDGDIAGFYTSAEQVGRQHRGWIVLCDKDSEPLFNTREGYGAPVPRMITNVSIIEALKTGKPQISNLFVNQSTGGYQISAILPVIVEGQARYSLSLTVPAQEISTLLDGRRIASDWTVTVLDRAGKVIGRNHGLTDRLGQPVGSLLAARMKETDEAVVEAAIPEGTPTYTGFTRSAFSGWSVVIAVPRNDLDKPFYDSLERVAISGIVLLCAGLAAALAISRNMRRSM